MVVFTQQTFSSQFASHAAATTSTLVICLWGLQHSLVICPVYGLSVSIQIPALKNLHILSL